MHRGTCECTWCGSAYANHMHDTQASGININWGDPRATPNPKTNIGIELSPCLERQQGILDRLVEAEACNPWPQMCTADILCLIILIKSCDLGK